MQLSEHIPAPGEAPVELAAPWTRPDAEPFVRIESVSKHFDDFVAVDNISLDIYRSELFCLLGGSGSGKSTLLRMLAGFETPTTGRILIDGTDISRIPAWKRPVNMMFQSYALFPHLTVADNVAFGLRREGVSRAEAKTRVAEMLELVQLGHLGRRKPHQLSGGQRQRTALARSLIKKPKLLLLDEPLGALDKKLREETQFELINIQENLGVTFMVVTHDQEEAMTLSTRIGVMNQGRIVQVGEPHEVYEYPQNRFVAEFVGSVNLFDGQITEDEPDYVRIHSPEAGASFYVNHGISCSSGQKVALAVRPEKIRISHERPGQPDNCIEGSVDEVAYMGSLSVFRVLLPDGKAVRVTKPNMARRFDERFKYRDRVYLSWGADSCVVLTS